MLTGETLLDVLLDISEVFLISSSFAGHIDRFLTSQKFIMGLPPMNVRECHDAQVTLFKDSKDPPVSKQNR